MRKNETKINWCKERISIAEKMVNEAPTKEGREAYKKRLKIEKEELAKLQSVR